MTREEVFEAWAPAGGTWSNWVKPAPFAHLPREMAPDPDVPPPDLSWVPPPVERFALVIDLPGATSVHTGLALAGIGYQPVPLFNSILPPVEPGEPAPAADVSVVAVEPILSALVRGSDRLRANPPPADAPPAFLIDADRQTSRRDLSAGAFDNRSVVFVTDFPSAALLARHGITRAVLVRQQPGTMGEDLTHSLQLWQQGGMTLVRKWLSEPGPAVPLTLPKPGWWIGLARRLRALLPGIGRNAAGEFGVFVSQAAGG
ncbi:MAG TPA: hypothetical protein VKD90_23930 [Gemmataceae bacterium]|nr:hypothetical protein [Gemmataceae bacterium]